MSNDQTILELKNVGIKYGDLVAVSSVDIEVKKGEFFGIIGVNGAGKTSLIKTILGLRDADEGVVSVMGQVVSQNKTSPHIAFLPERFEPSWFLSGLEFLKFSAKTYGQKHSDEEYYKAAEDLALDPKALKRKVQTYSKGMRQKLGVLATVMTESEILLLDEPMSGLDPVARTRVKDLLLKVSKQGRTIFMCSHILADMDEVCDRICLIHDQEMKFIGAPSALREQTKTQNLERAFLHYVENARVA
ncbi:MAG: ABC transporter family protein [Micavibrio sp.]|mgnify:CR=1 FL=1|nr:ABC transporter family protein [Micavibrio sp.]|tara:strand:- start:500 stop:1237 length:738 start_codon:yes stop_codon:yes gene_type:complete